MNTIRDYYALFIIILLYLPLIEIILPYSASIRAIFCIILNYSALFSTIRKLLCSIQHYYALFFFLVSLFYTISTLLWTIYTILHYFLFFAGTIVNYFCTILCYFTLFPQFFIVSTLFQMWRLKNKISIMYYIALNNSSNRRVAFWLTASPDQGWKKAAAPSLPQHFASWIPWKIKTKAA